MKLILFTTKVDKEERSIKKEAKRMSLSCQTYFYEELVYKNGKVFISSLGPLSIQTSRKPRTFSPRMKGSSEQTLRTLVRKPRVFKPRLFINQDDKIILRDPYNTKFDYSFFMRKVLEKYYKNISLDIECYSKFPFYEDKLFQADFFFKLGITTPETFLGRNIDRLLKFPVIVKPRIGSRGRGILIFNKPKEIETFFAKKDPLDYIIQKYHKAKSEYRILIFRHKVLGVVDKHIYLKGKGGIGVRINKVIDDFPINIKGDCIKITKRLKADFVGVDVIHAEDGKYYFLEANLSPQFGGFAKVTKLNVAGMVIRLALT